jgi:hypothetical protein
MAINGVGPQYGEFLATIAAMRPRSPSQARRPWATARMSIAGQPPLPPELPRHRITGNFPPGLFVL